MIQPTMTITEAMHHEPLTALALKRYTLSERDGELRLEALGPDAIKDVEFVVDLINYYTEPSAVQLVSFGRYSLSVILDYLQRTHTYYLDQILPRMEMTIHNVQATFPDHPIVRVLDHFYRNYQNELLEHIELEEKNLFPYAKRLYDGQFTADYSVNAFRSQHTHDIEDHLTDVLLMVETEYDEVARSFAYRSFKNLLKIFQHDLHIHHQIEEVILLQKLKNLENEIDSL